MTSATIGLIGGIGVGLGILAVGLCVRGANGRRLIRGVDWTRVSRLQRFVRPKGLSSGNDPA